MGQTFSGTFFSASEEVASEAVKTGCTVEEAYDALYREILTKAQEDPYNNTFLVTVPGNPTSTFIEDVVEKLQVHNWKVEKTEKNSVLRIVFPVSQSLFVSPEETNPERLFDIIVREVTEKAGKDPYNNSYKVRLPISFRRTASEERNLYRQGIQGALTHLIARKRWTVTFVNEDPFQSDACVLVPLSRS